MPVTIDWYKYDGVLSDRANIDSGTLYIENAQVDDSGVYICQAEGRNKEIVRDNVTLTISSGGIYFFY
jgi:Immunoglobulin I-set domain